jgi:hypothetical protein
LGVLEVIVVVVLEAFGIIYMDRASDERRARWDEEEKVCLEQCDGKEEINCYVYETCMYKCTQFGKWRPSDECVESIRWDYREE